MAGHSKPISKEELWGGGQSPFSVSYGKMMMWFFLVSDALTFGGLLTAYGVVRHGTANPWPVGEQVFEALPFLEGIPFPLIYVALMTFILIISSVTMVLAVEAGHRLDKKGVIKWLGLTIIGGFFFVGSQAWEWSHFIHGSGGGFQISHALDIKTDEGRQVHLNAGTWVHMTPEFGHEYEHALEAAEDFTPKAAAAHGHAAHGEHADGHGNEHHADINTMTPPVLIINKYVRTGQGDDAVAQQHVTGAEMEKIWKAKEQHTFAFGANMSKNEYGPQQYANFFFFVTGFHGFHVFSGVVINIIIWLMVIKGAFDKLGHYEMIEKIGLYWHFVDLVWVFVFTFFYLV